MSYPPERESRRRGLIYLVVGWLVLLLALASGALYVLIVPPPDTVASAGAEVRVALPRKSIPEEPAKELRDQGSQPETEQERDQSAAPSPPGDAADEGAGDPPSVSADGESEFPPPVPVEPGPVEPVPGDTGPVSSEEDAGDDADSAETEADRGAADEQVALVQPPLPEAPAWQRYARRLRPPTDAPKIAVVVRGLGLSSAATEAAITQLPGSFSLAFSPYARRAAEWAAKARRSGHEVLIDLPMEPVDFPARDPGPQALRTRLGSDRNLLRLEWILDRLDQEVGVVAQMGSAFLAEPKAVGPILDELKQRGLMYVDNGELRDNAAIAKARGLALPFAVNDRTIDGGQVSRPAIEARLVEIERIAQQDGLAVALARPFPVTLETLKGWASDLDRRGFALVPVTHAALSQSPEAASLR